VAIMPPITKVEAGMEAKRSTWLNTFILVVLITFGWKGLHGQSCPSTSDQDELYTAIPGRRFTWFIPSKLIPCFLQSNVDVRDWLSSLVRVFFTYRCLSMAEMLYLRVSDWSYHWCRARFSGKTRLLLAGDDR